MEKEKKKPERKKKNSFFFFSHLSEVKKIKREWRMNENEREKKEI